MVQWLMFHFVLYVYTLLRFLKYYISVYLTGAEHNGSESWCSVTFFISLPFLDCFLRVFVIVVVFSLFCFFFTYRVKIWNSVPPSINLLSRISDSDREFT